MWQNSASIYDKTLNKLGIQGTYLNMIQPIYDKYTDNIMLNREELKAFSFRSGRR